MPLSTSVLGGLRTPLFWADSHYNNHIFLQGTAANRHSNGHFRSEDAVAEVGI